VPQIFASKRLTTARNTLPPMRLQQDTIYLLELDGLGPIAHGLEQ
jgi:hypothetical protein